MTEAELNRRVILATFPLDAALIGIAGMTLLLGAESINLAGHLTQAKTVAEVTTTIVNSINPMLLFGGLRMAVEHANDTATIFAAGVGPTIALMFALAPRRN